MPMFMHSITISLRVWPFRPQKPKCKSTRVSQCSFGHLAHTNWTTAYKLRQSSTLCSIHFRHVFLNIMMMQFTVNTKFSVIWMHTIFDVIVQIRWHLYWNLLSISRRCLESLKYYLESIMLSITTLWYCSSVSNSIRFTPIIGMLPMETSIVELWAAYCDYNLCLGMTYLCLPKLTCI